MALKWRNGHLLWRGGHLACGCCDDTGGGGGGCGDCGSGDCDDCPDGSPAYYHVTFSGVSINTACQTCPDVPDAVKAAGYLDGTYIVTTAGSCLWVGSDDDPPLTVNFYPGGDCTSDPTTIHFAIEWLRVSSTQFRLRVMDSTLTVLAFEAFATVTGCCESMTLDNAAAAACDGSLSALFVVSSGGTATLTPC